MTKPFNALPVLGLAAALLFGGLPTKPAQAQFSTSAAPVGGSTGSISRPGWSRGQAPSSNFDRQGAPLTRNQIIRQRAAAARGQTAEAPAQPRRPASRATRAR
ncbi:hypothetical protein [Roseomonas sp. WA12]